jgi:hypothetical protein
MSDERKAFEAWYESPTRPFCESDTSAWGAAWAAWQARAALTQATATAAPLPSSPESAGSDSSEPLSAAHWTTPCIPPAGVAQEAGALLRDPVKTPEKDAREWVNRLGDQYAARQVAALRADDKAIDAANFWIGTIALEHVFDILQSVRPAPIQEAGAREPVAWMHECRHLSCDAEDGAVISAKSKEIWMGAKPEHVEHYTIPLYAHPPTTGAIEAQELAVKQANLAADYMLRAEAATGAIEALRELMRANPNAYAGELLEMYDAMQAALAPPSP